MNESKPVVSPYEALTKQLKDAMRNTDVVDFSNTEIAFEDKSDKELKRTAWLFRMMNKPFVANYLSQIGALAVKWHIPFSEMITRETIFRQFCGGRTLLESQETIERLAKFGVLSILDY
ncbi:MAG: proline dehydrogenase, partial [Bacteroidetes bacterium]